MDQDGKRNFSPTGISPYSLQGSILPSKTNLRPRPQFVKGLRAERVPVGPAPTAEFKITCAIPATHRATIPALAPTHSTPSWTLHAAAPQNLKFFPKRKNFTPLVVSLVACTIEREDQVTTNELCRRNNVPQLSTIHHTLYYTPIFHLITIFSVFRTSTVLIVNFIPTHITGIIHSAPAIIYNRISTASMIPATRHLNPQNAPKVCGLLNNT